MINDLSHALSSQELRIRTSIQVLSTLEEAVKSCYHCGSLTFNPYYCRECGQYFCAEHRGLKQHDCESLKKPVPTLPRKKTRWLTRLIGFLILIATTLYILDFYGVLDLDRMLDMFRDLV